MKKASILFYSLVLVFFLITAILAISFLFLVQSGTIETIKKGNNAYYAAKTGIEHGRSKIYFTVLNQVICDGTTQYNVIMQKKYLFTYRHNDTSYSVNYWFICSYNITGISPYYILEFTINNYEVNSLGEFRGTKNEMIFRKGN